MSGYSVQGKAREPLDMGALGFVQKPFRLHPLLETIERALF